jgi:HSP20 family protein
MTTARWAPFVVNHLHQLHKQMNDLFDQFGGERFSWPGLAHTYPPVNLWEDEANVYAEAELPGMDSDKLEIYVAEGNQLTIQGDRNHRDEDQGTWHRRERGIGKFSRVITLPVPVNADNVKARFEHGVLHLTLPKSETAKPKKIVVKTE